MKEGYGQRLSFPSMPAVVGFNVGPLQCAQHRDIWAAHALLM